MTARPVAMGLAALLLCGCAAARTAPPAEAGRDLGPAPELVAPRAPDRAESPSVETPARSPIDDLAVWDAAGHDVRESSAAAVASLVPGVVFEGLRTFECGEQRHEIAVFRHVRTGIEMSLVPGGDALLPPESDEAESAPPPVRTPPFLVARTELTAATWARMESEAAQGGDDHALPVSLSCKEADAFCDRFGFRQPSPAQWERAACGGAATRFCFGDDPAAADGYGWLLDNSGRRPHPVGGKLPNAFGLFDVIGNVREWCRSDAGDGESRGIRGSSFDRRASASTRNVSCGCATSRYGLRPVLVVPAVAPAAIAVR